MRRTVNLGGLVILMAALPLMAQLRTGSEVQSYLSVGAKDWQRVEHGEPYAKVLTPADSHEAALAGVIRVNASLSCFLTHFEDIESFKKNPAVLEIQKMSWPPRREDLARVTLNASDIAALPGCRQGRCGLKLPPGFLDVWKQEARRATPSAERTQELFRESLLRYLEAYLAAGDAALVAYQDSVPEVKLANEFRGMLAARPGLAAIPSGGAQDFYDYLLRYPQRKPAGASEFLYWSVENFGLKPVLSVTHALQFRQAGFAALVSKQLYANHYFDASMGLTLAVQPAGGPLYLVYINRSRVDLLGGMMGGLKRRMARGRALDGVRKNLQDVAARLTRDCGGG